ncbi:Ribosomal protein 63, mitochondrial [Halocaridina rubra]|uniref:Ribosomal protein 63, mitochondrial n=1 Tax=Halocaridina rubra TaxID=373956 RepID=A0AAN9AGA8_HALRR
MRTTFMLLARFRKTYPGNIYGGKNRKRPYVDEPVIASKVKAIQLEEQNMFYLRHPYLTLEQSWGHAAELGRRKDFIQSKHVQRVNEKTKPHVTLEEQYDMLRVRDVWD